MTIKVSYEVFNSGYFIDKFLHKLTTKALNIPFLSFDTETKGVYTKKERNYAQKLLNSEDLNTEERAECLLVANNDGLSQPSLVEVTHFIFGLSENKSVILIPPRPEYELHIWEIVATLKYKLIIHKAGFDLNIMYNKIKKFPKDWEDSFLAAKTLLNNVNVFNAKTGLKELMGEYYDPAWSLFNDYEPDNLKNEKFLMYCAIDGAATVKLWQMIIQEFEK